MKKFNYNHTIFACFFGFVTQAIVNNFIPLLFLTFQSTYGISLDKIALLISFNFGMQLVVDLLAMKYADRIGHRTCMVAAHVFSGLGLILIAVLPEVLPDPYVGLMIAVLCYAIGGGLIEVLASPIVEACPTERKESIMSILHSFYCWGHVAVVVLSTVFFATIGIEHWKWLSCFWGILPLFNGILFLFVPLVDIAGEKDGIRARDLLKQGTFWVLFIVMFCSGASEHAVGQWSSAFAENALGVDKLVGDLLGPCAFGMFMGISRAFHGKYGDRFKLKPYMMTCAMICAGGYLLTCLVPSPVLSLIGCMICGLAVGIMWPGTFSLGASNLGNSTAMAALFAVGGDLGCTMGPALVGFVAEAANDNLKLGILTAVIFPVLLFVGLMMLRNKKGVNI